MSDRAPTPGLAARYRTPLAEDLPEELRVIFGDRETVYRKVRWPVAGTGLDARGAAAVGLRYGENPHQSAAFYTADGGAGLGALSWLKLGKGGPSWINLADIEHALRSLRYFERPAVAVMKHLNPAGLAVQTGASSLAQLYEAARDCDARAAFGGVVVCNVAIDEATAEAIARTYIEVVAAPGFAPGALAILGRKKDLRVARIGAPGSLPRFVGDPAPLDLKVSSDGSLLVQQPCLTRIRSSLDLVAHPRAGDVVAEHAASPAELEDLLFAWYVSLGVRSNAVVIARDGRTLAVGTGEQERIGAIEQAIAKARQKGHSLAGAVMSSDAFFPFRDAIDAAADAGIRAIVQPGGSLRDAEVLAACNERGVAILFTQERCFAHF